VASRLFTDSEMVEGANSIIADYIATGRTILSEAFLKRLEDEDRTKAYGGLPRQVISTYGGPCIADQILGAESKGVYARLMTRINETIKIPDSGALRIFTDPNLVDVANSIVRLYINTARTVLSESFLQILEGYHKFFEIRSARVPHGVQLAIRTYEVWPFIPDQTLGQQFKKMRRIFRIKMNEKTKIPDSEALRLFLDKRMEGAANSIVQRYIETGETILSEAILQQLEDFEQRAMGAENRLLERFFWGANPSISDEERGQAFVRARQNRRAQQEVQIVLQWAPNEVNLGNQNAEGQEQDSDSRSDQND